MLFDDVFGIKRLISLAASRNWKMKLHPYGPSSLVQLLLAWTHDTNTTGMSDSQVVWIPRNQRDTNFVD